jgi:hypothetical protein
MKIYFNTMVKNEGILLDSILPIWKLYPVDKFIFYNDNSNDDTVEVIKKHLQKDRFEILNDNLQKFHEAYHRSKMLEYSRDQNADFVFAIDSDELLSDNLVTDYKIILKEFDKFDIWLYWYNVVENSLQKIRQDPLYKENYRSFILPVQKTEKFNLNLWKYHTPRVPNVNLNKIGTKDYGVIHLQAINERFYALKQLWYKHYEFKEYKHDINQINLGYDPVVNNLNFMSVKTPSTIIGNLNFDSKIFDEIEKVKKYKQYIIEHNVPELVTFGKNYLI